MKTINLTTLLLLFAITTWAQKQEPLNPQKDQQEFEGYTIRLLPAMGGTYGYDIRKGHNLVVHQLRNPFTASPLGLDKKEDAFKLAQWQITQLKGGKSLRTTAPLVQGRERKLPPALEQRLQLQGSRGPVFNQRLPVSVAKELQISVRQ